MADAQNLRAKTLKALHKSYSPIIMANVYDAASAKAVASLTNARAIATASYAVAKAAGVEDDDLTRETNIRAVRAIALAIKDFGKPLSVDFQDGYGDELEVGIAELIEAGVVGINLEDWDKEANKAYHISEAVQRIRKVLAIAQGLGVPDFVVNARIDTLVHGGEIDEVISRGQAYLAAGATTVFVWGGTSRGGISRREVRILSEAFDGQLNVLKVSDGLSARELADIGVARISIGPTLQISAMEHLKQEAEKVLVY